MVVGFAFGGATITAVLGQPLEQLLQRLLRPPIPPRSRRLPDILAAVALMGSCRLNKAALARPYT